MGYFLRNAKCCKTAESVDSCIFGVRVNKQVRVKKNVPRNRYTLPGVYGPEKIHGLETRCVTKRANLDP